MHNIMEICAWAKPYSNLLWAGFPHCMNINNFSTETSAQYCHDTFCLLFVKTFCLYFFMPFIR